MEVRDALLLHSVPPSNHRKGVSYNRDGHIEHNYEFYLSKAGPLLRGKMLATTVVVISGILILSVKSRTPAPGIGGWGDGGGEKKSWRGNLHSSYHECRNSNLDLPARFP